MTLTTMKVATPMQATTTMNGYIMAVTISVRRLRRRSMVSAARAMTASSVPVCSPTRARCITRRGKRGYLARASAKPEPSCICWAISSQMRLSDSRLAYSATLRSAVSKVKPLRSMTAICCKLNSMSIERGGNQASGLRRARIVVTSEAAVTGLTSSTSQPRCRSSRTSAGAEGDSCVPR
jgi:hypothetical protein